jgi:pimeloyl-ACP methyl ester carboxylesterase
MTSRRTGPSDADLVDWTERPFFFSSGAETLFGIVTDPVSDAAGADSVSTCSGVVLASGGWLGVSTGRNRTLVRLARDLAARNLRVLRFDYRGVGESTGTIRRFELAQPFVEDLQAAVVHGRAKGISEFCLIGFCFGARTALVVARDLPGVKAVVLVSTPVHEERRTPRGKVRLVQRTSVVRAIRAGLLPWLVRDVFRRDRRQTYVRLLRARLSAWRFKVARRTGSSDGAQQEVASGAFLEAFEAVLARGIPVLMVYGTSDAAYEGFIVAGNGHLGRIVERYAGLVEVVELKGDVHGLGRLDVQDAVIDTIARWTIQQASVADATEA